MRPGLQSNRDFLAGLLFSAVGLAVVVVAWSHYPIGTTAAMGPGYFPTMLGGILAAFGLYIMGRGVIRPALIEGRWAIRPLLLITVGVIAFGFVMDHFGMVPALLALFFISALGGHEFKFTEVVVLSAVMLVIAWGIFIYGLGVPFRLFVWGY
jgi:putative tricarboxylic transport membrane protein